MLAAALLTFSLGVTQFGHQKENHWFQQRYPHELRMTSGAAAVGYKIGNWTVYYQYLGRATSWALADPDDDNYRPAGEEGGPCRIRCLLPVDDLPVWRGRGAVHGLGARYRLDYGMVFVEAGVLAYRPTWTQRVERWYGNTPDWVDYPAGVVKRRIDIEVRHKPRFSLTPELAVGYRLTERVSLVAEHRFSISQGGQSAPLFKYGATSVLLRVEF